MKITSQFILTLLLLFIKISIASATENACYMLRSNSSERITPYATAFTDITQHAKHIQLLIAQAYHIDQHGIVTGSIDATTVDFAKTHGIKLMIMVTNSLFDNARAHLFLSNNAAEQKALQSILELCATNHYDGVQFDFEGINIADKDLLTTFFKTAATLLHQHGLKVSFAVIPTVADNLRTSQFLIRKYNNWSGVYDLKTLGEISDFVTLMSYDQHSSGTTPGSFAGIPWVEATLQNTLQYIPPQKISLGIPTYSSYWKTSNDLSHPDTKISVTLTALPYSEVTLLLNKNHANIIWDNNNKNYFAIFDNHFLNTYLFIEDKRAFKAKMQLVKKYQLRGISLFDIGNEDPGVWDII